MESTLMNEIICRRTGYVIVTLLVLQVIIEINLENIFNLFVEEQQYVDLEKALTVADQKIIFFVIIKNTIPILLALYFFVLGIEIVIRRSTQTLLPFPLVFKSDFSERQVTALGAATIVISGFILLTYSRQVYVILKLVGSE